MITEEDINMLQYYHQEKGDITRDSQWENLQPKLREHYPALIKARNDYVAARQALDMIVAALEPIT